VLYDVFVHTPSSTDTSTSSTVKAQQPSYVIEYDPSTPAGNPEVPPLLALVKRYVLRAKVRVRDATPEFDVWAAWGSAKPELRHWKWAQSGVGEPVWDGKHDGQWPWGVGGVLWDRRAAGMGTRRLVPKGMRRKFYAPSLSLSLNGVAQECETHDESEPEGYLLHRIAHGVAEGAVDIQPAQAFPMESNLDVMGGSARLSFSFYIYTSLTKEL
jgi:folate-binding Fe-S cluster repair protein YgfZ